MNTKTTENKEIQKTFDISYAHYKDNGFLEREFNEMFEKLDDRSKNILIDVKNNYSLSELINKFNIDKKFIKELFTDFLNISKEVVNVDPKIKFDTELQEKHFSEIKLIVLYIYYDLLNTKIGKTFAFDELEKLKKIIYFELEKIISNYRP